MSDSIPVEVSAHHILVVEDDDDLRRMLERMLRPVGAIETAVDGQAAWEKLKAGYHPDLIVTDRMMPRMDGDALVKQIKSDGRLAKIPIIMLTARSNARDVVTGINTGVRHYVTKPFQTDDLIGKVKKLLGIK